jgi:hypothetical protein
VLEFAILPQVGPLWEKGVRKSHHDLSRPPVFSLRVGNYDT